MSCARVSVLRSAPKSNFSRSINAPSRGVTSRTLLPFVRNSKSPVSGKRFYCDEKKNNTENENTENTENKENGTNELEKLRKDYEQARSVIIELKEEILRARADAENTRKIAHRDVENAKEFGITSFAKNILEVNDNLKRALDAVAQYHEAEHPQLHALYEGVSMTKSILVHALEKHGIVEYESLNQPFNPALHEALFRIPYSEDKTPGSVGAVITSGYKIKSRILRAAQVGVVDTKPEEPAPSEQTSIVEGVNPDESAKQ